MATILATCHFSRLFRRYCRRRATSNDVPERPERNSFNHCLTMIAPSAVERLMIRAANHSALSATVERGTAGGESSVGAKAGCVELMNDCSVVKLASCNDMCCNTTAV